jgi:hypothetical protein
MAPKIFLYESYTKQNFRFNNSEYNYVTELEQQAISVDILFTITKSHSECEYSALI